MPDKDTIDDVIDRLETNIIAKNDLVAAKDARIKVLEEALTTAKRQFDDLRCGRMLVGENADTDQNEMIKTAENGFQCASRALNKSDRTTR